MGDGDAAKVAPVMPKEQRSENYVAVHSAGRDRMKSRLARISEVDRLELQPAPIEDVLFDIDPDLVRHIVIVLPHAHVVPDIVLGSFRFSDEAVARGNLPEISMIQMPC